jgi:hypothetical protein
VESVAISADESWDLSELVDLEVFGGESLGRPAEKELAFVQETKSQSDVS